jgi:hypothetical protein
MVDDIPNFLPVFVFVSTTSLSESIIFCKQEGVPLLVSTESILEVTKKVSGILGRTQVLQYRVCVWHCSVVYLDLVAWAPVPGNFCLCVINLFHVFGPFLPQS